jgi:Coenzyme PQQ synthesis protein D (PqqD)
MQDAQSRLKHQDRVIFQEVGGQQVLLNLTDGLYYALDGVGARIWELCDGTRTVSDVIELLCQEYEAARKTIQDDTLELLEDLVGANLVVQVL